MGKPTKLYKHLNSPKDLFPLPNDVKTYKKIKIDKDRTIKAVEKFKKQKIWQIN